MSSHHRKSTSSRNNSKNTNTAVLSDKKKNAKKDETENVKLVTNNAEDAPHSPAGDIPAPPTEDVPPPTGDMPPHPTENVSPPPGNSTQVGSNAKSKKSKKPKNPKKTKRILIWVSLGVLASFLPLLFSIIRDFACGFNTLKVNYFRDLALIVAAIAANALSCALAALEKYWSCALSALSFLVGSVLYYLFRPDEQLNNTLLNIMIAVCAGLLVLNAIVGFLIACEEPAN